MTGYPENTKKMENYPTDKVNSVIEEIDKARKYKEANQKITIYVLIFAFVIHLTFGMLAFLHYDFRLGIAFGLGACWILMLISEIKSNIEASDLYFKALLASQKIINRSFEVINEIAQKAGVKIKIK